MSEMAPDLGVDTTLKQSSNLDDVQMPPGLSDMLVPEVSSSDFASIMQGSSTPAGFSRTTAGGDTRQALLDFGKKFIGTKYTWGGTNPTTGFDCSGFTQYVAKAFGVNLPRLSYAQANAGERMSVNDLQPGDLVLFNDNDPQGPGHVAFYAGNGQILESPHTGASVRIRSLGKNENVFGVHLNIGGK